MQELPVAGSGELSKLPNADGPDPRLIQYGMDADPKFTPLHRTKDKDGDPTILRGKIVASDMHAVYVWFKHPELGKSFARWVG